MYCAYVTTIRELRKHNNADRLQCATIFGNNVIVDLSYVEGQRVVYFPVDGQLGEEFAKENNLVRIKDENGNNSGGYLDPSKRNITALKLRGEQSDGLVLPIEVLAKYTDVSKLTDGEQITILNGYEICRKYIPRTNAPRRQYNTSKTRNSKNDNAEKVAYPFFVEHIDTAQLAYNEHAFKPGDTCYITLKMHGTSARTMNAVEVTTKPTPKILKKLFIGRGRQSYLIKVCIGNGVSDTAFTAYRNNVACYIYNHNIYFRKSVSKVRNHFADNIIMRAKSCE